MTFLVTCSLLDLQKNINKYCISIIIIMDIIKEAARFQCEIKYIFDMIKKIPI